MTSKLFKVTLGFLFFAATFVFWTYSYAMTGESRQLLDLEQAEAQRELAELQKSARVRTIERLSADMAQTALPITSSPPGPGEVAACENGGCIEVVGIR